VPKARRFSGGYQSIFRSPIAVLPDPSHSKSEERFMAIGKGEEGRGIFCRVHAEHAAGQKIDSTDQRPLHAQEGNGPL
jgi:hypothetical protein